LLAPTPTETSAPRPATAESQPSPPHGLSEERLLAAAVRALRSQNDARSALAALDEYRTRYPQGRLSVEASALRASALVALDRRDEALRVLDGLDLAHVPGGFERQLQRGELRASVGRHQDATADFDAVLARVDHGDLAERALWRRAQSRLQGGDRAGAQRDAALYLQRHPTGQFAALAARLLELSP
jgi:outer membrane protein assembly factor BamD (BamD/ComL family)